MTTYKATIEDLQAAEKVVAWLKNLEMETIVPKILNEKDEAEIHRLQGRGNAFNIILSKISEEIAVLEEEKEEQQNNKS